jgi:N-sulfoglucosamine sulfohydrolase
MWLRQNAPLVTNLDGVELAPYFPDTPKARRALAYQYDNIAIADQRVGELLNQLVEDGLAADLAAK